MRKIVLATAMAGTALTLTACGDTSDVPSDVETMEPVEQIETYPDAVDVVANASTASAEVPVNLNTATAAQIALIPGMTDRMVGEFLEYQPYENMDEFDREIGKYVDEDEVARLRRYVTL